MADEATPLGDLFRRLIRTTGPISLTQYMGESNARYYASRDPLGGPGDFTTAPEISQMFGELIGLWLTDIWRRSGVGAPVHYVELGPGRGTLTKDALRAVQQYGLKPQVHLVETSQTLREVQRAAVLDAIWHDDLSTIPQDAPILLVANEFLDALPIRQLVRDHDGWCERMVGLRDGNFAFVSGGQDMTAAVPEPLANAEEGAILETCPAASAVMQEVAGRLARQGGAAIFIDYGYIEPTTGSTFQAVRDHEKVSPLASPGEADLTALVDFATLAEVARNGGVRHLGTATQGDWLRAMGIDMRADGLAKTSPQSADDIHAAKDRLIGKDQMGDLFKVMALSGPDWPDGAGFEPTG